LERSNSHSAYATELAATLDEDRMPSVDFDRLKAWLAEIGPLLVAGESSGQELAHLRDDYIGRISGMIKAIAAADRKGNRYESALSLIDTLPSLSSAELVECYRKTCARFRDCFPASFSGQFEFRSRGGRAATFSDYK
jgi:hypothetical protein